MDPKYPLVQAGPGSSAMGCLLHISKDPITLVLIIYLRTLMTHAPSSAATTNFGRVFGNTSIPRALHTWFVCGIRQGALGVMLLTFSSALDSRTKEDSLSVTSPSESQDFNIGSFLREFPWIQMLAAPGFCRQGTQSKW